MTTWLYTLASVAVVSATSLIGILTLSRGEWLGRVLDYLVSLAAGALLGGALLHLLPHAVEISDDGGSVWAVALGGFVTFFLLEKLIWAHHHHQEGDGWSGSERRTSEEGPRPHERHPHHGSEGHHRHGAGVLAEAGARKLESRGIRVRPVVAMNLIGDTFHNFVDGAVIAAAFLVDPTLGIVTSVAVLLHEVPQELGDFGVLVHGGLGVGRALIFNFLSASAAFVGAILTLLLGARLEGVTHLLPPLIAGAFIYIAAADLIPELHKERRSVRSLIQIACFLAGIGAMAALAVFEDFTPH